MNREERMYGNFNDPVDKRLYTSNKHIYYENIYNEYVHKLTYWGDTSELFLIFIYLKKILINKTILINNKWNNTYK